MPRPGRFYIENVQGHGPRIEASCLERGGGGGWWWWMVMVMVVVVVREDEAGRKGAGYGIKKQNLTQGVRKKQ